MKSDKRDRKSCLVLIAHGSREARWSAPFETLAEELKQESGRDMVHLAFMESSRPTLLEVAAEIVRGGTFHVRLLPLFMSSGNHLARDLPIQVEEAQLRFPGLEITLLPPIGQQSVFIESIRKIARVYVSSSAELKEEM